MASSATDATTSRPSSISTRAGQNVDDLPARPRHPDRGDAGRRAGPAEPPPDALLIGIAPTGGRLPAVVAGDHPRRRSRPASMSSPASTPSSATTPSSRPRRAAAGSHDRRLPAPAGADGDGRRSPARPGQAGDPDRRHATARSARCRSPSSFARGRAGAGDSVVVRADRPDRDDDRGLGRRGRPADQRLRRRARSSGWSSEGEALGDWVIVEGQGSLDHPAYSSVTLALIHGATPQAMVMVHKPGLREHDFDHLPEASFPIAELPGFIDAARADRRPRGAVEGRRDRAQHLAATRTRSEARRVIAATAAETGLPTDDPCPLRAGTAVGRDPRGGRRAAVGRRADASRRRRGRRR